MTEVREDLITSVVNFLLSTRILPVLAQHQRALDALDMEGLSKLWNQSRLELAEQPPSRIGSTMEDPTLTEWTKFLDDYLSSHHLMDHSQPTTQNLRYYLQAYLLSATLKDCSIILRFDRGLDEPQTSQRPRDGSITVINLDPKSMRRLWLWEKLDRRTVEICMGVEEKRTCVDNLLP
jgi:inositol-pentakisphosphate 2-kinase